MFEFMYNTIKVRERINISYRNNIRENWNSGNYESIFSNQIAFN